jgi:hypothetical protein
LVGRARIGVNFNGSLNSFSGALRCRNLVPKANSSDPQYSLNLLDISFDFSSQIPGRSYSPRLQRGTQGAGQSPCHTCDYVIQGGRKLGPGGFATVLVLVEVSDSPVDSKVDRFVETFDQRGPMRALVLFEPNSAGVNNRHLYPPLSELYGC